MKMCMPENEHANHFLPRILGVLLLYPCRCAVGLVDSICSFCLWGWGGKHVVELSMRTAFCLGLLS